MVRDIVDVQSNFLGLSDRSYFDIHVVVVDRQVAGYCELITFRQGDDAGVDSDRINRHGHGPLFDLFAIHDVIDIQGDFLGGGFFIQSQVHGRAIYTDVYDKVIAQPSLIPESKGFHSGKAAEELLCFFGRIHNCGQAVGDGMPDIGNPRSSKVSLTAGHQDILIVIFCMQNIILIEVGVFLYQILAKGDVDLLDGVLDLLGFFFPLGSIGCVLSDSVGHFGVPTIKDVTLTGGIGTIIIGRSICTPQQILMDLVFKDLFALHAVIVGNRVLGFLIIGLTILVFVLCPDGVQSGVLCHCYFFK